MKAFQDMIRGIFASPPVQQPRQRMVVALDQHQLLAETVWGGHVVVPSFNMDVAVGVVRDGVIEPWTTRLVQELVRPGQTAVNIGANFGYYTALLSRLVGQSGSVYAFEANPHTFCFLLRTLFYSGAIGNTKAYNCAVSNDDSASVSFQFDPQFMGGGALDCIDGRSPTASSRRLEQQIWSGSNIRETLVDHGRWAFRNLMVDVVTTSQRLDTIFQDRKIDFLHMDVEGAEPLILDGAWATVDRSPDLRVVLEWDGRMIPHRTESVRALSQKMWDELTARGFRLRALRSHVNGDGSIEVSFPMTRDQFFSGEHGDYVAIRAHHDPFRN